MREPERCELLLLAASMAASPSLYGRLGLALRLPHAPGTLKNVEDERGADGAVRALSCHASRQVEGLVRPASLGERAGPRNVAQQLVRLGAALRGGRAGLHRRLATAEPLHPWMGRRLRIRGGRPARLERGRAATCRRLSLLDRERRVKVRRRVSDPAEQQAGSAGTQPRLGRNGPARASWPLGEQRRETRKGLGRPGRRGRETARCEVGAGERVFGPRL
mmetsp:Transcript_28006/g.83413  ORF Transcript_28006/g.83413 Transcript_28006/m.83413 type:complete len:220 (-) Transcript_28006:676-1335(-)